MNHRMRKLGPAGVAMLVMLLLVTLGACGSRRNPEIVVEQMYTALAEADQDTYLETLLPANRNRPDLDGVLAVLLGDVGLSAGGVGVGLGGLLAPTFADMEYNTVSEGNGHAVVQARGSMRMLMMEYPFCDTHDLVRSGGQWYIDKFHGARQPRLERLLERNQARLASQGFDTPQSDDPLAELGMLFNAFGDSTAIMLDMCE